MGHKNNAQSKFYVYVSTDATADAASCWTLAEFILALEKTEPKVWIHINYCLSSAKITDSRSIKFVLHWSAASDAENLCKR